MHDVQIVEADDPVAGGVLSDYSNATGVSTERAARRVVGWLRS